MALQPQGLAADRLEVGQPHERVVVQSLVRACLNDLCAELLLDIRVFGEAREYDRECVGGRIDGRHDEGTVEGRVQSMLVALCISSTDLI